MGVGTAPVFSTAIDSASCPAAVPASEWYEMDGMVAGRKKRSGLCGR
jgi:hypothetical protein